MASRRRVRDLLDQGMDHAAAGRALGIPAGQVHLIASGVPADGSATSTTAERSRALTAGQSLANPPAVNPTTSEVVRRWISERVASDAQLRQASALHSDEPAAVEHSAGDEVPEMLAREHNRLLLMAKRLRFVPTVSRGASNTEIRDRWTIASWIARELTRHQAVERDLLLPLVRRWLQGDPCDEVEQRARADEETAAELLRCTAESDRFEEYAADLIARVRRHVAAVDRVCLDLRESAPADALRRDVLDP